MTTTYECSLLECPGYYPFRILVEQWRRHLGNENPCDPYLWLPLESEDSGFTDIKFTTKNTPQIWIRFRSSSLHGCAYSIDGVDWREVLPNEGEKTIVAGSTVVGFTSNHAVLRPAEVELSESALIRALDRLAASINSKNTSSEDSLIRAFSTVVTMLAEGARFRCIESLIGSFYRGNGQALGGWALKWLYNWSAISTLIKRSKDEPEEKLDAQVKAIQLKVPIYNMDGQHKKAGFRMIETIRELKMQMAILINA